MAVGSHASKAPHLAAYNRIYNYQRLLLTQNFTLIGRVYYPKENTKLILTAFIVRTFEEFLSINFLKHIYFFLDLSHHLLSGVLGDQIYYIIAYIYCNIKIDRRMPINSITPPGSGATAGTWTRKASYPRSMHFPFYFFSHGGKQ
jgi:hypothetical protein